MIGKFVSVVLIFFALIELSCHQKQPKEFNFNPPPDNYAKIASIQNRDQWGAANVHDPSVIAYNDTLYLFSTDAIYIPRGSKLNPDSIKMGNIQVRTSTDWVNWHFAGWAFDNIPAEAVTHVRTDNNGRGADNIWAPYIKKEGDTFRLYYSVSAFGTNSSYIGLAIATHPLGPWKLKGCVVKTTKKDPMNAIDPTIITDVKNGKEWMIYGSYFAGIYCVELDPAIGLTKTPGDLGHKVATRNHGYDKIIEAPEAIYNPDLDRYYLFTSYDPLFTYYNVRVGQAQNPEGPYTDFMGYPLTDTISHLPILTHSYQFKNHPGWSGNGHCSVFNHNGKYFMLHQGRLAPDNLMMVLQVRELFWLPSGWPTVSPERYVPVPEKVINPKEIAGDWEVVCLTELDNGKKLWQGQIPFGGWHYSPDEFNQPQITNFKIDGSADNHYFNNWKFDGKWLYLNNQFYKILNGYDWENKCPTLMFTGIDEKGHSIWGKKINYK